MAGRRGHGEGTITKRKDGRWEAKLDLSWVNGNSKRKAFYGTNRRDVQDKLDEARQKNRLGLLPSGPNQSVSNF